MRRATLLLCFASLVLAQSPGQEILTIKRVYVDSLTGGETAAQMRDLIIASLHNSKVFILTEDPERADAILRGAAEDLIYTTDFQSKDGINMRAGVGSSSTSRTSSSLPRGAASVTVGDDESLSTKDRKHEAMAAVRLVNKMGDVIWSTTQESGGAKFHGASADVAEKITKQLIEDVAKAKTGRP